MTTRSIIAALLLTPGAVLAAEPNFTTPKLENLTKQIAAHPDSAQAYSNRGYTLALLGRKEQARADLKKAVELQDDAPMRNRVGWAYFNLGDYEEAIRHFEESAKKSDFSAHYDYYSLVLGYWGTKDLERALKNYQLAAEKDPRLAEFKSLDERTAEWTPLERKAMHEIYVLWSKAWKL
ncbi:MAG: tetratricopeptide repeat protein [Verrucomicrobiaceae bacterium]|nr:tetratricopeptide repeat protein [Verrucomicrobiaceae bacterium]